MKQLTQRERMTVLVSLIILVLFIGVSVLALVLYGMLEDTEKGFSDYRMNAEIKLSELEKKKNSSQQAVSELKNKLALSEKEKSDLEKQILLTEEEMEKLESSFNDKDKLYGTLNSQLSDLKQQLSDKTDEIDSLKKDIEDLEKVWNVDLNKQTTLLAQIEELLAEGAPMKEIQTPVLDSSGAPVLGEDGLPLKETGYTYPKISLYYEDLSRGYYYSYNGDTVFYSASCVKAPFALSILSAASEEKAEYDRMLEDYITQNGPDAPLPSYSWVYDFNRVFTYTEDKYRPGSGIIKNQEYGVQYTHLELFRTLLRNSDNVAYAELRAVYGTDLHKQLVKRIGADSMVKNLNNATATELGKVMKEIYAFTESDAAYASFMKEAMMSSIHTVMIGYGVSPKKIAHKYGWDTNAYHDMAIVYDEHPYVLVFMSDMDQGGSQVNAYIQKVVSLIDDFHENFYR